MATTKPSSTNLPQFDEALFDDAAVRIRALNEKVIESTRSAGIATLDAYEKALKSIVDFENKVATASQLDWVTAVANTHAKFVQDVSGSYIDSVRELLK